MTVLSAIRDRFSPPISASFPSTESQSSAETAESQSSTETKSQREAFVERGGDGALPFAGYDHLDARQIAKVLSDHSQIELEAVESYERSHRGREVVLNKLRYMRGSEPFPTYDALTVEEILAVLEEADLETIDRVRGYERKFANRPRVLEAVARVHRSRLATEPGRAVPAYLPMSARPARNRHGAQKRSAP
jgi:hypothetical protein